ncbi:hypothetical protein ADIAL_1810 [Alkalibacterium sp. AK22]|uniref:bacteriocin immunity protein n=1 Tax=Alkalibacterium sp. AK22 TaxID=1229520 RepID=UPI00044F1396|nr:bacteriocin immunity protein [Alkalibacterium sp. AK22]EXJ22695.1 hypothetical protein ADIAL_1810 [Alkalibacterium sp. AK22]
MNKSEQNQLIDLMSTAYSDPEVKTDGQMHQLLFDYAKQLSEGHNGRPICVGLSKEIGYFSLRNNMNTPQSLIELHNFVSPVQLSYGERMSATWWPGGG